jgi:protein-S-isoprenylcysteine O-methyltransferase Ste14
MIEIRPVRKRFSRLYDLATAAPIVAWYLLGLSQLLPAAADQVALAKIFLQTDYSVLPPALILRITSKVFTIILFTLLIVTFTVRRVPLRYASGLYPRFAAVAGTFLGVGIVMLPPKELPSVLFLASLLLIIGGTVFAIWTVAVLARSISIMPEARGLVISGPYALVRHPLYLGEFVALSGIALQYTEPWALLLLGLQSFFQFERMKYEERVLLRTFPAYEHYMAHTARLLPGLY